jgi:hypothetical protein
MEGLWTTWTVFAEVKREKTIAIWLRLDDGF